MDRNFVFLNRRREDWLLGCLWLLESDRASSSVVTIDLRRFPCLDLTLSFAVIIVWLVAAPAALRRVVPMLHVPFAVLPLVFPINIAVIVTIRV